MAFHQFNTLSSGCVWCCKYDHLTKSDLRGTIYFASQNVLNLTKTGLRDTIYVLSFKNSV